METWEGKSFSITDPKGVSTVIYQIIKTPKDLLKEYPKYALERLESMVIDLEHEIQVMREIKDEYCK